MRSNLGVEDCLRLHIFIDAMSRLSLVKLAITQEKISSLWFLTFTEN